MLPLVVICSRLPAAKEILQVSSEERRVCCRRRDDRRWTVEDLISEAELRLEAVPEAILTAGHLGGQRRVTPRLAQGVTSKPRGGDRFRDDEYGRS